MPPQEETPIRLNCEQMICFVSPHKRDIIEALLSLQSASVTQLAEALGRSSKSLYYHLRQLDAVQLVRVKETRRAGKRYESVYELTATRFEVEEKGTDAAYRKQLQRGFQTLLKKISREHAEASETQLLRVVAKLTPKSLQTLENMLQEAAHFARQNQDESGLEVSITLLLTSKPSPNS